MLKNDILYMLEKNKGKILSGGYLAKYFNVSRTAIWKTINSLRVDGNNIESIPNNGYLLYESSDGLSRQVILDHLNTNKIGKNIEILKTIDSTNQYIKLKDTSILPDGFTVISNEQTDGKGRLGRKFFSPANQGIYMSILLKPHMPLRDVPFLTLCSAVSVCRAIEKICNMNVDIKWVNDVFYNGKKLCGILTEGIISAEMGVSDCFVVGIGINTGKVAKEVENIASSIMYSESKGIRNQLISETLNQFEVIYTEFISGNRKKVLKEYKEKLFILGKEVTISTPKYSYKATVADINALGELLVMNKDGEILPVKVGEVIL